MSDEGKISYIDFVVEDLGYGHKILFVGEDGRVVDTKNHLPWFTVYTQEPLSRFTSGGRIEEVKGGIPLIYDSSSFLYIPDRDYRVYKVGVSHRSKVPAVAGDILGKIPAKAGLYNIRYEARVALDFSSTHKILGFPTPLVFLDNESMIKYMEEAIEKIGNIKVMAVDIEVYSTTGGFPKQGDPILTITYSVFRLRDNIFSKEWAEKNVIPLSIPRTVKTDTEFRVESRKLVDRFFKILEEERPTFIVTYNGTGFDFPYMKPHVTRSEYRLEPTHIRILKPNERIVIPHIDLMIARDMLGSSLGVRSQAAFALDDVALEVAGTIKKFYPMDWLFTSDYIKAERLLNHAKLREYWEKNNPLFNNYIVADVYLTSLIARVWLYSILMLSLLTGLPPTIVQSMNTGQIAEYLQSELLRRLGFYPELRTRKLDFSRVTGKVEAEDGWVFNKGKVYVRDYGIFGGDGYKILELDFAQLYPTDMVMNSVDPTMVFITGGISDNAEVEKTLSVPETLRLVKEKESSILLTEKKNGGTKQHVLRIVHGYGPISWFTYKLYNARKETKKLKERAKKEGRVELQAPDQAVKILNNSTYGSYSKSRGNLVSEAVSASVFWRTQKLLYQVIDYIDNQLSKELGGEVKVLYGDTDSAYVLIPDNIDPKTVAKKVNKWIQSKYGELYEMEVEDVYDLMAIPKQKDRDVPSAKSYICLKNGRPAKIKGEFFKIIAPMAIKERLLDFYVEIINRKPQSRKEIENIIKYFIEKEPLYKWFIKKSISTFVNQDDPKRLKKLNKDFHYAALYSLYLYGAEGVMPIDNRNDLTAYMTVDSRGREYVRLRINPRIIEQTQRAVIVHYLPHPTGDPKKFIVYEKDDGKNVVIHHVTLREFRIVREGDTEKDMVDKYYEVGFSIRRDTIPREVLKTILISALNKYVTDSIQKKLVPSIRDEEGGITGA